MFLIKRTDEFSTWLDGLKDGVTRQRLNVRLRKAMLGNLGDVRPVGEGWRMYYVQRGMQLIVMVGGGDKSSQSADIARAVKLAGNIEE